MEGSGVTWVAMELTYLESPLHAYFVHVHDFCATHAECFSKRGVQKRLELDLCVGTDQSSYCSRFVETWVGVCYINLDRRLFVGAYWHPGEAPKLSLPARLCALTAEKS